ncbi:thioredoxin domain-containing protein [Bacteroides sp.]
MKIFLSFFLSLIVLSCSTDKKKNIVAEVNGEAISLRELSQLTKQETFDLLNLAYDIKCRALDNLISQKLIESEANRRGSTTERFLDEYIKQRISGDEDSVFEHYGLIDDQGLYKNLYSVQNRGIEGYVQQKSKLRSILIRELVDSLTKAAKIMRYVYPPKSPDCVVEDLCTHYRGNEKALVNLIVASDFNCDRCVDFHKTLNRIFDKYQKRVKFGYVNFSGAPTFAALACEAAANQNKFWEFYDSIFEQGGHVDSTFIFNLAQSTGLKVDKFKTDLFSSAIYDKLDQNINELMKRGLFATPTIVINNRLIYITNSYEELSRLLDLELQAL